MVAADTAQDFDQDDPLAAHPLLQPVSEGQRKFIDTLFARVTVPGADWPVFDYVQRALRTEGFDAAAELAAFPVGVNQRNRSLNYRHVWVDGTGINEASQIRLTIAGLRQESTGEGRRFADFLARMIGKLAALEVAIEPNPDAPATAMFQLEEVLSGVAGTERFKSRQALICSILEREPPLFGCAHPPSPPALPTWRMNLRTDLSAFVGVRESKDYLRRLLLSIGADREPLVTPAVDRPLTLIDEIGYLDSVWRAQLGEKSLFGATKVSSCAGLALDCASSEEFDARMNALYDVLNRMEVSLSSEDEARLAKNSGSLQRLRTRLRSVLPEEEHPRTDSSIRLLRNAVRIRAALHSGVEKELPALYRSLDIEYPPTSYEVAWNRIRIQSAWAIRSIRQALEILPAPSDQPRRS